MRRDVKKIQDTDWAIIWLIKKGDIMDYITEINEALRELQEVTVVATYGNTKKLSNVMERLANIAETMKKATNKEAALDE